MSWRTVVISSSAKLDYQMGYLVVRKEETKKIYLNEISVLLIESTAVSLTAALLLELVKNKTKVIFCDEKRSPSSELVPYYGSHDTSSKIRKQIKWSDELKKLFWTEIVSEKIRGQAALLKKLCKPEYALLNDFVQQIKPGDSTNREGHAAKVYFHALFGMDFSRTAENSINAALNYGYGILLSLVNREVVLNGYLTQIGLFHDNMFNPFNLSSDLMEPLRPFVDAKVCQMMPQKFEHDEKAELLHIVEKEVIVAKRKEFLSNAVGVYCRSVFNGISENDISLIRFCQDEF